MIAPARPLLVAVLTLLAGVPAARAQTSAVHTRSTKVMGTRVSVMLWTDSEERAATAARKVFEEFTRLDKLMSNWLPDSDVSRIIAAAGVAPVAVSADTFKVIEFSQSVSKASRGTFDITVGAFRGLWKFDEDADGSVPDPRAVLERKKLVNWRDVVLDRRKRTVMLRRKGMAITLGGVAKGYAVDRARAILAAEGLDDFIVQAGGDLYVSGSKDGKPWVVGIRDPRGPRDDSFALAAVRDCTFSTSGDYERFVIKDGVRYHHILDPATAFPAKRSRSVTVMARDAMTGDAWSKPLFIMGAAEGMKLVDKLPDLEAVFVDADNKIHVSSGLKDKVKILHPPTPGI